MKSPGGLVVVSFALSGFCGLQIAGIVQHGPCDLYFLQVGRRFDQTKTVGTVVSSGRHTMAG